jgi:hypothetical protein
MRFAHRILIECFCIAALSGAFLACSKVGDDDDSGGTQTGTGGTIAGGTGGMTAAGTGGVGTAGGAGGMTAAGTGGMTAGGTGGMTAGGTGGMTAGGTGGMTAGGTGGMTAGGTGGTTGDGGMPMGDGGASDQCSADLIAADMTTTPQCAACLCTNCNAEVTAMKGDDKAQALFDCGKTMNCSGTCCFCGSATCGLDNYRMGPCAAQTEAAAGVPTPSDALTDGTNLMTACGMAGSSCNKPVVLADCTTMHCMTECPAVAACN